MILFLRNSAFERFDSDFDMFRSFWVKSKSIWQDRSKEKERSSKKSKETPEEREKRKEAEREERRRKRHEEKKREKAGRPPRPTSAKGDRYEMSNNLENRAFSNGRYIQKLKRRF